MLEHFFTCPYCLESISMLLDSSQTKQIYIEDCEVCCNPIELKVIFFNGELSDFQTDRI
ncbi:CPXCG motif-containing cysteine-rich protein [Formosa sp. A9]|uniref:CPXCG motif-containing cysteine-rich protein n=1 Tax=Formosa sp. A9 TaxID=3442641 RepID=UPI003EBD875C